MSNINELKSQAFTNDMVEIKSKKDFKEKINKESLYRWLRFYFKTRKKEQFDKVMLFLTRKHDFNKWKNFYLYRLFWDWKTLIWTNDFTTIEQVKDQFIKDIDKFWIFKNFNDIETFQQLSFSDIDLPCFDHKKDPYDLFNRNINEINDYIENIKTVRNVKKVNLDIELAQEIIDNENEYLLKYDNSVEIKKIIEGWKILLEYYIGQSKKVELQNVWDDKVSITVPATNIKWHFQLDWDWTDWTVVSKYWILLK